MADEVMFALLLQRLQYEEEEMIKQQRRFISRADAFNSLSEEQFKKLFRLSKDLTLHLIQQLRPHFPEPQLTTAIPLETEVVQGSRRMPQ